MKSYYLMKSRFVLSLILAITIISYPMKMVAQACGQAIFTLEFYTVNGEPERTFKYEIYQVDPEVVADLYGKMGYAGKFEYDRYIGTVLEDRYAEFLIDFQLESSETLADFKEILDFTGNKLKGESSNGKIELQTIETYMEPYLIKLESGKKHIYLIADAFGGCDRTAVILWNDFPKTVAKHD